MGIPKLFLEVSEGFYWFFFWEIFKILTKFPKFRGFKLHLSVSLANTIVVTSVVHTISQFSNVVEFNCVLVPGLLVRGAGHILCHVNLDRLLQWFQGQLKNLFKDEFNILRRLLLGWIVHFSLKGSRFHNNSDIKRDIKWFPLLKC
jgi:hypothetical protein